MQPFALTLKEEQFDFPPRPKYSPFASVTKPDENGNRRLFCLACGWTQPTDHTNTIRALNEARRLHPETDCKRKP